MTHVLSSHELMFVRSERDHAGFIRSARRRYQRNHFAHGAPKRYEHKWNDEGKRTAFTVVLHAETGEQIGVADGHI